MQSAKRKEEQCKEFLFPLTPTDRGHLGLLPVRCALLLLKEEFVGLGSDKRQISEDHIEQ